MPQSPTTISAPHATTPHHSPHIAKNIPTNISNGAPIRSIVAMTTAAIVIPSRTSMPSPSCLSHLKSHTNAKPHLSLSHQNIPHHRDRRNALPKNSSVSALFNAINPATLTVPSNIQSDMSSLITRAPITETDTSTLSPDTVQNPSGGFRLRMRASGLIRLSSR